MKEGFAVKQIFKRLRCFFYSCLFLIIFPFLLTVTAETEVKTEGDYQYIEIDNSVTIISYNGTDTEITIPSILGGLPVTQIGNSAFINTTLVDVTIPDSITHIGEYAFMFNYSLTNINISSNVVSIGEMAFAQCKSLTQVVLPSGVAIIGNCAFAGCTNLQSIRIPASVTSIGELAFNHGAWEDPPQYPIPGLSIIGYENTYAQSYAKANEIPFIAIKDYPADTLGDVNADDAIDAQDALLALQQSVKTVALGEASAAMADVDKNGAINARDALLMLQYSVHLINRFD